MQYSVCILLCFFSKHCKMHIFAAGYQNTRSKRACLSTCIPLATNLKCACIIEKKMNPDTCESGRAWNSNFHYLITIILGDMHFRTLRNSNAWPRNCRHGGHSDTLRPPQLQKISYAHIYMHMWPRSFCKHSCYRRIYVVCAWSGLSVVSRTGTMHRLALSFLYFLSFRNCRASCSAHGSALNKCKTCRITPLFLAYTDVLHTVGRRKNENTTHWAREDALLGSVSMRRMQYTQAPYSMEIWLYNKGVNVTYVENKMLYIVCCK